MNCFERTVKIDDRMTVKRLFSHGSVLCDVSISGDVIQLYPMHRYNRTVTIQVTSFLTEQLGKTVRASDLDIVAYTCKMVGHALWGGAHWYCV